MSKKFVPMFYASRRFGGDNKQGFIELYTKEDGNTMMFSIEDPSGTENIILSPEEAEFIHEQLGKMLKK